MHSSYQIEFNFIETKYEVTESNCVKIGDIYIPKISTE